ncbi:MAG: serine protease [Candidatus Paceibacterota bacterium]|jgi:S1-C subfamily serine protease
MEHLNKQQLILLALLVSFVTSIATGIVTVALMNQAPQGFIQTINRVVERTVERVVPSEPINNTQTIVKETVVVTSDDMIVSAIDKNSNSVLRIYRTNSDPAADSNSMVFVGLGLVVSDDGIIATDNSVVSTDGRYFVNLSDKKLYNLSILRAKQGEQIALLKIPADNKNPATLPKAVLLSNNDIKLGQTVVYIGGESKNLVSTGIISSLATKSIKDDTTSDTSSSTPTEIISSIETNINSGSFMSGAPLVNLSGEIVAIKATFMDSARTDLFVPSKAISDALASLAAEQKKVQ